MDNQVLRSDANASRATYNAASGSALPGSAPPGPLPLNPLVTPATSTPPTQPFTTSAVPPISPQLSQAPQQPASTTAPPQASSPTPPKPKRRLNLKKRWIIIIAIALVAITGATLLLTRLANQALPREIPVEQRFGSQPIELGDLTKAALASNRSIAINGQMTVNGSLVIKPSSQPTNPVTGQIYYDQGTNQLQFYDGTQFLSLLGTTSNTVQNTINNSTTVNNLGDVTSNNGTPGRISKFADTTTLVDSILDDDGAQVTVNGGFNLSGTSTDSEIQIFPNNPTPGVVNSNEALAVEVGVKFRTDVPGKIRGIRFYKGALNTGTHVGHLWTSSGIKLGEVTFTNEGASGWQEARFATPISIAPGTTYIASYHAPNGRYSANSNFFSFGGIDNESIHALENGQDGPNGVYGYGPAGTFPSATFQASNYWVDVVFNPGSTSNQYKINGVQISSFNLANNTDIAKRGSSQVFTGNNVFRNGVDSTNAFGIQTSAGINLLTASTQDRILTIGTSGGDSNGALIVLGNKNTDGDPFGVNGAMYYNSFHRTMRCYRDGFWSSCSDIEVDHAVSQYEEFLGGQSTSFADKLGSLGWNALAIGANGTLSFDPGTPTPVADRPGVLAVQTPAVANQGTTFALGSGTGSMLIRRDSSVKTAVAVGSTTGQVLRVGLHNQTTASTQPLAGAWWEANPAVSPNWRYCYGDGAAAACTASAVAIAADTWVRLEIRVLSTGPGVSNLVYLINGTSIAVNNVNVSTTTRVSPALSCFGTDGAAHNCFWDYFQLRGQTSGAR